MASFEECLRNQLASARVPRRKVNAAIKSFESKRDNFISEGMSPADAEARAGDEAAKDAIIAVKEAARRSTAQALASIRLSSVFERTDINLTAGERLKALVSPRAGSPIQSYETLRDVVRGHAGSALRHAA